jgi:hypothetical protein
MTLRPSSLPPESIAAIAVGLTAGFSSTILTGWAQVSDLGRAIIFVGSCLSGALFTYWSSRSSGMATAVGKSALAGALQANIAATGLVCIAFKVDQLFGISPMHPYPGDMNILSLALIMAIAGSIVGFGVGLLYGVVPALVAHWRKSPSLANTDRAMFASAVFVAIAAAVHASIVKDWAAWLPLVLMAAILATAAGIRTATRAAFLARVRAGEEPRYRIEPTEGRSVLYRIAEEDDREVMYREQPAAKPEPEAIGVL